MKFIFGIISYLLGIGCMVFSVIKQSILCYKKFGVILSKGIIVPHWSLWFLLLGFVLFELGRVLIIIGD